jgi:hypothetical protein
VATGLAILDKQGYTTAKGNAAQDAAPGDVAECSVLMEVNNDCD